MTESYAWDGTPEFRQRAYDTYDAYAEHQASKLKLLVFHDYNPAFKTALRSRVAPWQSRISTGGQAVLCLAARNGAECEAFCESGFLAIGIDLNPGEKNRFVLPGDFHEIQFPAGIFDVVFTNSLDHVFELGKVIDEARRVLKDGGLFVAEIVRGTKDENGREPGLYESVWWDHASVVACEIEQHGFERLAVTPFEDPWVGDQYVYRKPVAFLVDEAPSQPSPRHWFRRWIGGAL